MVPRIISATNHCAECLFGLFCMEPYPGCIGTLTTLSLSLSLCRESSVANITCSALTPAPSLQSVPHSGDCFIPSHCSLSRMFGASPIYTANRRAHTQTFVSHRGAFPLQEFTLPGSGDLLGCFCGGLRVGIMGLKLAGRPGRPGRPCFADNPF